MARGNGNGGHRPSKRLGPTDRRRKRRNGAHPLRIAFAAAAAFGFLTAALALAGVAGAVQVGSMAYAAFTADLPSVQAIENHNAFKTVHIYDRHGTALWEFWEPTEGKRDPVPLREISQNMIDASLAAEDAQFYANPGVDIKGIIRAALQNVSEQDVVSGASTITQQLVRNILIPERKYERSIERKLAEAFLAYRLTQEYSKDQILELYLNEIYYGNMSYGVEAAAMTYFNKHARDLNLAEAALIAGLPQAPSLYDPYVNPQAALERRSYVLEQMARHGFVSERDAQRANREPLNLTPHRVELRAPHWVNYVKAQLEQRFGPEVVYRGGLKVFTTLDLGLQTELEAVARANYETLAARDANNTAISAVNPKTGEILAMVGSMDYWDPVIDGQVNVLLSERQPGSSIKPLVYMLAFTRGWSPSTIIDDVRSCWTDAAGTEWCPQNYDRRFHGKVSVRTALGNSLNIPAVKALEHVGIESVRRLAEQVGISSWREPRFLGLSLTLGGAEVKPLELAGFYATLANNGQLVPLVGITRVVDAQGNVLLDYEVPAPRQVVDARAAYMVTHILKDNSARLITYGPNSLLNLPRPAAAKTGTTDNYRDTWTMGYTPNLVVGVWVGNADGRPMREVLSSMSAGKIWREAMDTALAYLNLPPEDFPRPPGIVEVESCGQRNQVPGATCTNEVYLAERAPRTPTAAPVRIPAVSPTPNATRDGAEATPGTAQPTPNRPEAMPTGTPPAGQSQPDLPGGVRATATPVPTQGGINQSSPAQPGQEPTPRPAPATPVPANTPVPPAAPTAQQQPQSAPPSGACRWEDRVHNEPGAETHGRAYRARVCNEEVTEIVWQ